MKFYSFYIFLPISKTDLALKIIKYAVKNTHCTQLKQINVNFFAKHLLPDINEYYTNGP
jgi:hypothetical protein